MQEFDSKQAVCSCWQILPIVDCTNLKAAHSGLGLGKAGGVVMLQVTTPPGHLLLQGNQLLLPLLRCIQDLQHSSEPSVCCAAPCSVVPFMSEQVSTRTTVELLSSATSFFLPYVAVKICSAAAALLSACCMTRCGVVPIMCKTSSSQDNS